MNDDQFQDNREIIRAVENLSEAWIKFTNQVQNEIKPILDKLYDAMDKAGLLEEDDQDNEI